jgi:hypothetical protein
MEKCDIIGKINEIENDIKALLTVLKAVIEDYDDSGSKSEGNAQAEPEVNMVPISELKPGTHIKINGVPYTSLFVSVRGSFGNEKTAFVVLRDQIDESRSFDDGEVNDWEESDIRAYLLGEWRERSEAKELKTSSINRNLMTDDGLLDYGSCSDDIFLLTADEYRRYRQYIKELKEHWWLATGDSVDNKFVSTVCRDGTLTSSYSYQGYIGVRPALALDPSVLVEVEPETTAQEG